jgi:hypothetical protein
VAGRNGAAGVQGATGASGASGATGAASTEEGAAGAAGAAGRNGATGATGATGEKGNGEGAGTTGPMGPTGRGLPATLGGTEKETGVWIITTPHGANESAFHLALAEISFPVPLAKKLHGEATCPTSQAKVTCPGKQMTALETKEIAEGKKAMPGCKATAGAVSPGEPSEKDRHLLEEPEVEPGNLCVYTGVEEMSTVPLMSKQGTFTVEGENGVSPTGASVGYANEEVGFEGYIKAQGSWAVEAGA